MSAHHPQILVIDDEPQIHRFLRPALEAAGFEPMSTETGKEGLAAIANHPCDAVILDLGLPDMDGKEVLSRARGFYFGPIIVLSARDMEIEKISALDLGADDYVEKPFRVGELLARLRVAMRRNVSRKDLPEIVRAGEIEIDLLKRLVTRNGVGIRLSPREYNLLVKLVEGGGRVLTHHQLLTSIWGPAHVDDVQYLRVFMGHLRQKLEADPSMPRHLLTESGVGYRFVAS